MKKQPTLTVLSCSEMQHTHTLMPWHPLLNQHHTQASPPGIHFWHSHTSATQLLVSMWGRRLLLRGLTAVN